MKKIYKKKEKLKKNLKCLKEKYYLIYCLWCPICVKVLKGEVYFKNTIVADNIITGKLEGVGRKFKDVIELSLSIEIATSYRDCIDIRER